MKATQCSSEAEVMQKGRGHYFIDRSKPSQPFIFLCTPADDLPCRLPLFKLVNCPSWLQVGSDEEPTLTPSINVVGTWHGYLEKGEFITA